MRNKHPIALRYDPFITFFEKRVSEIQQQVEMLRTLEPLYNTAKLALETHKFPHETKLSHYGRSLTIYIQLGESHYREFDKLLLTITEELARLKLREPHQPAENISQWDVLYTWHLHAPIISLKLLLSVPFDGNQYCEIVKTTRPRTEINYNPVWHDEPRKNYKKDPNNAY